LLEHDPVITGGRHARPQHFLEPPASLRARGIEVRTTSRGGDLTYHGPGQLVGYPVFHLRRGLVAHVELLAAALTDALATFGVRAEWRRDRPGLWVGPDKVCAFGFHVRHRVAIHGFALNVSPALEAFSAIVPCGLRGAGVTSIERLRGAAPDLGRVAAAVVAALAARLGRPFRQVSADEVLAQAAPPLPTEDVSR
jgi:lipoyl(octanoyl) transferase